MIIAMAGLPGTGKTTLARELENRLHALVLNKDTIRAKLFLPGTIDYSREQDDLCMEIIFMMAEYFLKANPEQIVLIDGRTFSRSYQVEQLLSRAHSLHLKPVIIECICDDAIARKRLDSDQQAGTHPAGNRTYQLYSALKEKAEPIKAEHLVIDTGKTSLEGSVEECVAYVREFLK